jgi:hypothetical protein
MLNDELTLSESAQLALQNILQRPTQGIPTWMVHIMNHEHLERLAGQEPNSYVKDPEGTYLGAMRAIGVCMLDQFLPNNPLTMCSSGYDESVGVPPPADDYLPYNPATTDKSAAHAPTTGDPGLTLDGTMIDSPEKVVDHLEQVVFKKIQQDIANFDENRRVQEILTEERRLQALFGGDILKAGFNFVYFPYFYYGIYGYENYFLAYALYPEIIEKHFALQGDYALLNNQAAARAYQEGGLPPFQRLDFDMADGRGTLVSMKSLEKLWFPHFARCLEPMLKTEVRMIWHCDGNLMAMVPRLLDIGLRGFQGFQYEFGMDYEKICAMKTKDGQDLLIIGGISVSTVLPFGKPSDVKRQIDWLVEKGPRSGLFLGASSTVTPEVPWENLKMAIEGLQYYQTHGRS